ncbi:MAG: hypothetical protein ACI9X4_000011 [Glaciecola sp.]|jgi:hypothetical protein
MVFLPYPIELSHLPMLQITWHFCIGGKRQGVRRCIPTLYPDAVSLGRCSLVCVVQQLVNGRNPSIVCVESGDDDQLFATGF